MSDGEGEFFFYAGATAPTGCAHLCIHKGRSNGNPDVYWRNNLNNGAFVIFRPSDGEVALYYGGNRYHDDDTSNSGIYGDNAELDVTIKYNRNAKYEDDALTWQVYVDGNLVLNTYDSDNDWWAQNADIYWGFGAYNTDPNIEDDDGNLDPNTFALSYVKMVVSNVPGKICKSFLQVSFCADLHYLGTVYTLAGRKSSGGYANGIGTNALFANPLGVAFDNDRDCLFISDTYNHVIRRINFNGYCADGDCVGDVLFVAGRGIPSPLYGLRDGSASVAKFHNPTGLAVGPDGNIVVCDFSSNVLRVINPDSGNFKAFDTIKRGYYNSIHRHCDYTGWFRSTRLVRWYWG